METVVGAAAANGSKVRFAAVDANLATCLLLAHNGLYAPLCKGTAFGGKTVMILRRSEGPLSALLRLSSRLWSSDL